MKFFTVQEMAKIWNITERRVVQLCSAGKIEGACKEGKSWYIPEHAQRPVDKRVTTGQYTQQSVRERAMEEIQNNVYDADGAAKMRELPDESVDMIVCELPFEDNAYGRKQVNLTRVWTEYARIIKPQGNIVLLSQGANTSRIIAAKPEWFKYKMVWIKNCRSGKELEYIKDKGGLPSDIPSAAHIDICVFSKEGTGAFNTGCIQELRNSAYPVYLDKFGTGAGFTELTDVICFRDRDGNFMKSAEDERIALGRLLGSAFSKEGDVILDNASDEGALISGCFMEGRNFISVEKNMEKEIEIGGPEGGVAFMGLPSDIEKYRRSRRVVVQELYTLSCKDLIMQAWRRMPEEKRAHIAKCGYVEECMETEAAEERYRNSRKN